MIGDMGAFFRGRGVSNALPAMREGRLHFHTGAELRRFGSRRKRKKSSRRLVKITRGPMRWSGRLAGAVCASTTMICRVHIRQPHEPGTAQSLLHSNSQRQMS